MSKVIWGINPVLEALKSKPDQIEEIIIEKRHLKGRVYQILDRAKKEGIPFKIYTKEPFAPPKIPPQVNTQGVVAYLREFHYATLEDIESNYINSGETPIVIALDEIEDPQNLGAILRLADASGSHGVIIPKHRSCQITGTVVKVSAGSAFNLPISQVTNLKEALLYFKERNLWVIGLSHRAEKTIYDVDLQIPLIAIAGNEERGIRPSILDKCDLLVKIPMRGKVESLNVSQAIGIFLFEVIRQRYYKDRR
ncbi:MAG: 23S rRNA (guanosine(2251)-2'-O)-methyltransferase RlmB [Caldimicrobium sp.]|nr:23S rRNA (guanosine(2251)-2'-O)-methyltransferase RlmB [Caldimicrobium sp.]MCX7613392.1 23S rRNA (guanosine(2251)-2'-O)-methyltransferase RlmB [Caldimicrobium sp.]MDW8182372.1 23S rRNA (guanosine(2251)-2'-O)-methyltransferase RlmB [Caldimicrobium sp.]